MAAASTDATERISSLPARHLRVLGLPGSGKTRHLVARYHALSQRDPSRNVFIVTYSRDELKRIMHSVLGDGSGVAGPPPVTTYFSLARDIVTAAAQPMPRIIEGLEETLLVRRIVDDHGNGLRSDYRTIYHSDAFQRELLELFHLLVQHDVRHAHLHDLENAAQGARVADVLRLYRAYLDALDALDCRTFYDMAFAAAAVVDRLAADHPYRGNTVWLVDDFQDIDAGQYRLLTTLAPPQGDAVLNVFGDPMGPFFAFRGTQSRFLMSDFTEQYACETVYLTGPASNGGAISGTLRALADEIPEVGADVYLPREKPAGAANLGPLFDGISAGVAPEESACTVRMEIAQDEVAEVHAAAARIQELIARDGRSAGDVAVLANDKALYEPLLRAALAQRGIALESGRPPQTTFRNFVQGLLLLLADPHDGRALQLLTTSSFYAHFRSECLQVDWPLGRDTEREHAALRRFLSATTEDLRSHPAEQWMLGVVQTCLLPACEAYAEVSEDDSIFSVMSLLNARWVEYASAAERMHVPADVRAFVRTSGFFGARRTTPSPADQEVGLYSCREVKGRSFPVVWVLGCAETLFPSLLKRDHAVPVHALQAVVNDALPQLRLSVYKARGPMEHLHEQYHLLFHTLTRARDELYLSAPASLSGQKRPASSIIAATLPQTAYESSDAAVRVPPPVRFARRWVSAGRLDSLMEPVAAQSPIAALWNMAPLDNTPFAIDRFPLSKTSLETYLSCPRRFFYLKVLGMKEEESGALTVGNIFHSIMARMGAEFSSKRALHEGVDDEYVRRCISDALAAHPHVLPDTLFAHSLDYHLFWMLKSALRLDREESDDYTIDDVEATLDFAHRGHEFTGRADLVTRTASGAELVDFKTGKMDKMAVTVREKTLKALTQPEWSNWQVPLYVWGYRAKSGEWPKAFRFLASRPESGSDSFYLSLLVCRGEEDVPPPARSKKRVNQRVSYLLETEIEAILNEASGHATEVFRERHGFERTDDRARCRNCMFNRVCQRSSE